MMVDGQSVVNDGPTTSSVFGENPSVRDGIAWYCMVHIPSSAGGGLPTAIAAWMFGTSVTRQDT